MKRVHPWSSGLMLIAVGLLGPALAPPAAAQDAERVEITNSGERVEVTSGGERIVVDGDYVRVEAADGTVTEVDWRTGGDVYVSGDTEAILVELGAVTVEDRIQLNLAGDILFDFDSSAILPAAAAQMAKVAHVIRDRAMGQVYVIGHTDSIGDDAYNRRLSQQRAGAVMHWLSRQEGIPADLMVGVGMGAARPVAHNTNPDGSDSPAGRARNRRVEVQMATREGVRVGPEVVIGPGGVRVSEEGVSVGGGAIRVDPGGVRVGGVEVTPGGVRVGGVHVGAGAPAAGGRGRVVSAGYRASCTTGEVCALSCPDGDCVMECGAGAVCDFSCSGGDCRTECAPGAVCDSTCSGGDCPMRCAPGAVCEFGCAGGDCEFRCDRASECKRLSCVGGDCVCSGPAC